MRETVHLSDGTTVEADISGLSFGGLTGSIYLLGDGGSLQEMLEQGRIVEVEKWNGEWVEQDSGRTA